jgi:hypothetical protein
MGTSNYYRTLDDEEFNFKVNRIGAYNAGPEGFLKDVTIQVLADGVLDLEGHMGHGLDWIKLEDLSVGIQNITGYNCEEYRIKGTGSFVIIGADIVEVKRVQTPE